ncbi:MAG: RNA 2',3'-cyclic phosphodiesterase [Holophagae bacterium]|jgi:2'-5' RNA ligase
MTRAKASVRAFVALEIPEVVRAALGAALESIRGELPRARWTRPDGWHLTLKFLGEVERPTLGDLVGELAVETAGCRSVAVQLGSSGFFPRPARPRVAWVGGEAPDAPMAAAAAERAAHSVGFGRGRRPWSLHLTVARLRWPWPESAVSAFLDWGRRLELEAFECREVVLFRSDLRPDGAVYTALERFPLQ